MAKEAKEKKTVKKKTTKKAVTPKKVTKSTKPKTVTKKSTTKKVVKKVEIVKEEPKQPEKWYVWLKNNIIENEKELSREDKNRRLIVSLFAVFCFLVVLLSTAIIDYSAAIKKNEIPFFVIKTKDEHKQLTIYYGAFYKAWKCDNGDSSIMFGRFNSEIGYCELEPEFDVNGIYTNPHGVRITKSQMNIIKNYYFDDFINIETEQELDNAYRIAKALNSVWWVKTKSDVVLNNDPSIEIAIFGKTGIEDGVETWKLQYTDTKYHECIKEDNGKYLFATYNATNKTCKNNWRELSLDSVTCELAKNNTKFVSELVVISGLCK